MIHATSPHLFTYGCCNCFEDYDFYPFSLQDWLLDVGFNALYHSHLSDATWDPLKRWTLLRRHTHIYTQYSTANAIPESSTLTQSSLQSAPWKSLCFAKMSSLWRAENMFSDYMFYLYMTITVKHIGFNIQRSWVHMCTHTLALPSIDLQYSNFLKHYARH